MHYNWLAKMNLLQNFTVNFAYTYIAVGKVEMKNTEKCFSKLFSIYRFYIVFFF